MKARIEFTHYRGQLAGRGDRARAPLVGQVGSYLLTTKSGTHQVVKLTTVEVMDKPLAELYDVSLYCFGADGFQIRGLERISTQDGDAWVLQGWLLTPLR